MGGESWNKIPNRSDNNEAATSNDISTQKLLVEMQKPTSNALMMSPLHLFASPEFFVAIICLGNMIIASTGHRVIL